MTECPNISGWAAPASFSIAVQRDVSSLIGRWHNQPTVDWSAVNVGRRTSGDLFDVAELQSYIADIKSYACRRAIFHLKSRRPWLEHTAGRNIYTGTRQLNGDPDTDCLCVVHQKFIIIITIMIMASILQLTCRRNDLLFPVQLRRRMGCRWNVNYVNISARCKKSKVAPQVANCLILHVQFPGIIRVLITF